MELIAHPDWPSKGIEGIHVELSVCDGIATLIYRVRGAMPRMAGRAAPERADDLWRHTCFELFVGTGGEDYYEFNFAPSTRWAAYRFHGYRSGREDLAVAPPVIEPIDGGVRVSADLSTLPRTEWRVGVSAVIEESDGTMSYWALAHPPGKADFHDPACFALTISM